MTRVVAAAGTHLVVVAVLMLVLGYPLIGPYDAVGLLVVGATVAALHVRWSRSWPAVLVLVAVLAAVGIELATPGPLVAVLGAESVTTGVPVLGRYAAAWPLLLALALLAGLLERPARPRWPVTASVALGAAITGLVLLTGITRGWLTAPPFGLSFGVPLLLALAVVAVLLRVRAGLLSPAVLLALALGVAMVASWVQPLGDPVAGLVASAGTHLAFALLWGLVEFGIRVVARRHRTPAPT